MKCLNWVLGLFGIVAVEVQSTNVDLIERCRKLEKHLIKLSSDWKELLTEIQRRN